VGSSSPTGEQKKTGPLNELDIFAAASQSRRLWHNLPEALIRIRLSDFLVPQGSACRMPCHEEPGSGCLLSGETLASNVKREVPRQHSETAKARTSSFSGEARTSSFKRGGRASL